MTRQISIRDYRLNILQVDDEVRISIYEQLPQDRGGCEEPVGSWFGKINALPDILKAVTA